MSQSVHSTPSHPRTPSAHAARGHATPAGQAATGTAPAGLFALLLRGQQDEAQEATPTTPAPETDTEDASAEPRAETPETPTERPPQPPEAPTPPAAWTPTVRGAPVAEPAPPEGSATDPLQRLGAASRARGPHGADGLERQRPVADDAASTDNPTQRAVPHEAAAAPDTANDPSLARAVSEPVPEPAAAPAAPGTLPSLGHVAETAAPAPSPAPADAATTARAHLPQPPTSPAFAPALGLQLSTWLREGVQHAALELNPAELGPIDVRIALRDGQAQVALTADVPFTRQALADALPQLAEALGEVGVQLSGGDVSDQAGRRAREQAASGPRTAGLPGSGGAVGGETATPAPASARRRGLLDLYA
ncbi:flagellar hook-length control protein FliK [Ideonella sp. 4Y16]|uniref:Flagellar hook-length control protein FliK n=1 Tax=Ideonella alba TaxID=2824118 RepID=A0A940Y7N4_9BURK|nr:flagellar hook-length control protein FliK [Ideonella alba]MBQ0929740.1 flagellar hook-length control protein FliK [Ideonella alba]MBQ0941980.1 flagellar hook-length control protein FliK [Ideonella alba]